MKAILLAALLLFPACTGSPLNPSPDTFDLSVRVLDLRPGHVPTLCLASLHVVTSSVLTHTAWDFGDGLTYAGSPLIYTEHGYPYPAGPFLVSVDATDIAGAIGHAQVLVRLTGGATCSLN